MPAVEGGMGMYQTREYFERAASFGHYEDPPKFPKDSPARAYEGTGFGEASELIDQYVKAFEKVWARKSELAKA